jgi:hypothetical protein
MRKIIHAMRAALFARTSVATLPATRDIDRPSPHSALADRTSAEFVSVCSGGIDGDKTTFENTSRLPRCHRTGWP